MDLNDLPRLAVDATGSLLGYSSGAAVSFAVAVAQTDYETIFKYAVVAFLFYFWLYLFKTWFSFIYTTVKRTIQLSLLVVTLLMSMHFYSLGLEETSKILACNAHKLAKFGHHAFAASIHAAKSADLSDKDKFKEFFT